MTSSTTGSNAGSARPFARKLSNQNVTSSGLRMRTPIDQSRQELRHG